MFGLGKVSIVCFVLLFFNLLSVSLASAQETVTLIVYSETQDGRCLFFLQ
jgi:hypothetical protein